MRLGFHVSIAGGFSLAPQRAFDLGCTTMQIFSRNPRSWAAKPLDPADVAGFKEARASLDIRPVFVHTNYLINLAAPGADLYERSIEQFAVDLKRADALGAEYLVTHLGSASGQPAAWMIGRVAEAVNRVLALRLPRPVILLENAAGEAGEVGSELEQLQVIISHLADSSRIGICYDTCHGFAAGYDMRSKKDVDALAVKIEKTVGLGRLRGIHLNDSLRELGSRVDRHWHIGEGRIGRAGFRALVNHPAFRDVSKIMETPKKSRDDDPRNMKVIRSLIRKTARKT